AQKTQFLSQPKVESNGGIDFPPKNSKREALPNHRSIHCLINSLPVRQYSLSVIEPREDQSAIDRFAALGRLCWFNRKFATSADWRRTWNLPLLKTIPPHPAAASCQPPPLPRAPHPL